MTFRNISAPSSKARDQQRDVLDRLERLERGSQFAGLVSFGPEIQVGDVKITVLDNGIVGRTLIFENLKNGTSYEIEL